MGNVPRTRTVRIRATEQEMAGKPHTRTLCSQSEMHQRNGKTDKGGPAILLEKEALREFVGLWSGWLVVGFMLGGVLGRRSFGGL